MIKVSAPGKLILFGEHAVVHGRPCIVTAINHRMCATIDKRNDDKIVLNAPDVGIKNYKISLSELDKEYPKGARFALTAVKNFFRKYKVRSGLSIKTKCGFSSKFGFGGSSAVTVCIIKGLAKLFGIKISNRELFNFSYKTVLGIQKVGSGFDVAAAVYGGTLFFVTGGKIIERINVKTLPLVVGYTGIKADTPTLVKMVNEKKIKYPSLIDPIFNLSKEKVIAAKKALENNDLEVLGELMNFSHGLLTTIGVSCRELDKLVFAARKAGAYGAKLSGAGGGDCMIAVVAKKKRKQVEEAIIEAGGEPIPVVTNTEGIRIEKS